MTAGDEGLPRISGLTEIAVGVSRLIYIYGQVADHSELDVREQLRSALGHVDRLLQGAGGRPAHILSVAMNLRRAEDYAAVMSVWDPWSAAGRVVSRPRVSVKAPADGRLVDLDVVAAFSPTKLDATDRTVPERK
jgi:enamine deaminase RidA (YjgF/YER057c/UK114 family)